MAKIVNITEEPGARHASYGENYYLARDKINLIGHSNLCNIRLKSTLGGVISREHALVLRYRDEFCVGDISTFGTSLSRLGFVRYYPIKLPNFLDSDFFMDKFNEGNRDFDMEGNYYRLAEGLFDDIAFKRKYFLERFVMNFDNVKELVERGFLYLLKNRDIIKIADFSLQFRKNLVEIFRDFLNKIKVR